MPGADPANARQNYYNIPFNVFAFSRLSHDATIHVPQHQPAFLSYITLLFLRQTYGNPQFSSCAPLLFVLSGYVLLGLLRLQNSRFFIQNHFREV